MEFVPTPENLAMVAGVVLSLAFSYVPGLTDWYEQFDPERKRLVMLGMLAVVAAGSFGLACAGILIGVACTIPGAIDLVWAFILAVIANQSIYAISPRLR